MEERKIAIHVSGVTKRYRLGQIGGGTLRGDLQSWWAGVRGREDPNLPIGQKRLAGQTFMALNGVELTVYQGEALGIIGSNGAGKSTLLKLLSRITGPTEGEIDIYGRISSMLEVGTGFNGEMTGRENIYMNGAILGMTRAEIDSKIEAIIDFSEVREFIDTPVKRYSSGMFVKLAFAVAAHLSSEILVMDEVLAVGDIAFQKKCLAKMREAATREGRTVLYVSHNMNTIWELCSRCVVMEEGRIIYDGEVEPAISLYMNRSVGENEVDMDLTEKAHTGPAVEPVLRMEHLTLEGKAVPVYDNAEPLVLRFRLRVNRPVTGAQLRVTFRTNTDQGVGTAWSEPMDFARAGEQAVSLSFPLSSLARGTLYCSIGFYQMDDLGRMLTLDHITRAFKVEIQPRVGIWGWNAHAYGPVILPEGKVLPEGTGET